MAKNITAAKIERMKPGRHSIGFGLSVLVARGGSRVYVWRGTLRGKPVQISMGATALMDPSEAMELAISYKRACREGRNPIAATSTPTLADMVAKVIEGKRATWKNPEKSAQRHESLTETYAKRIMHREVASLTVADVEAAVLAIWETKHRTAETLIQILDASFALAVAHGHADSNVVRTLKPVLPKVKAQTTHQASCGYENVRELLTVVEKSRAAAATKAVIRFIALSGLRSREAAELRWSEVDMEGRVITIGAQRMKAGREFRLPISGAMADVLKQARGFGGTDYVFDAGYGKAPGDDSATAHLRKLHRRGDFAIKSTIHGFRNCLRDWLADCTDAPHEVAEAMIAHEVGSQVVKAYRRTDFMEQRRELLERWANFVTADNVTAIGRAA